ncbi:hypothetical protein C7N43_35060 [Sphingobacteriales bacterium UPWRP_1]|nr:hypothetical protein C7N43_35060 [Sphingobacteriales bacterium UPWRP_1]
MKIRIDNLQFSNYFFSKLKPVHVVEAPTDIGWVVFNNQAEGATFVLAKGKSVVEVVVAHALHHL